MKTKQFKFVYNYMRKHIKIWILGFLLTIIVTIIKIRYSWLMKTLMDDALIPKNKELLIKSAIMFGGLVLFSVILNIIREYCFRYVSEKSIQNLRCHLFRSILNFPIQFFNENKDSEVIERVITDSENMQRAYTDNIVTFFSCIITIVFVLGWLFYTNIKLSLIILLIVPFFIIITNLLWKNVNRLSAIDRKKSVDLTNILHESIFSIELVKIFGNNEILQKKFDDTCEQKKYINIKLSMVRTLANSVWESILTPYQAIIFAVAGIWYILSDSPSIGTIMAFINYLNLLIPALLNLLNTISSMAQGNISIERIKEYLNYPQEESGNLKIPNNDIIDIEFKNVFFKHSHSDFSIKNFNLKVSNENFVSILGKTGSGKSTIIKLLVRLYDVDSGEILINNINIKQYKLSELRSMFGFIQQDIYIYQGTIRDNLLYAKPDATMDEIEHACEMAQLNSVIENMKDKYGTIIGERGVTLSGGEKQRLSIARVLLKDSRILVMDEPTSNLDLATENIILTRINEEFSDKTIIVIDHRLSTLKRATNIIILKDGQIEEQGTYDELIELGGQMKSLIDLQKDKISNERIKCK